MMVAIVREMAPQWRWHGCDLLHFQFKLIVPSPTDLYTVLVCSAVLFALNLCVAATDAAFELIPRGSSV
jgi:hypothetical protein